MAATHLIDFLTRTYGDGDGHVAPIDAAATPEQKLAALASLRPRIAAAVKPIDKPSDIAFGLTSGALPQTRPFRIFDPELLLEQSAGFLDRCLAIRKEWDDLNERRFTTHLALWDFAQRETIRAKEELAGAYQLARIISDAEVSAETKHKKGNVAASDLLQSIVNQNGPLDDTPKESGQPSSMSERQKAMAALAYLSEWPIYIKDALIGGSAGDWQPRWVPGQWPEPWNYVNKNEEKIGAVLRWAQLLANQDTLIQQKTLDSQLKEQLGVQARSDETLVGLKARAAWDLQNEQFQKDRATAALETEDAKRLAFETAGGAYDFQSQMAALVQRFGLDASEALLRLDAAAKGLTQIYGYPEALPPTVSEILAGVPTEGRGFLDDAVKWTQRAMSWLLRFGRFDQSMVITISLRSLIGSKKWKSGWKANPDNPGFASWTFKLDDSILSTLSHVRMRGVAAYVVRAHAPHGVWQGAVTVPSKGVVRHLDGTHHKLVQQDFPSVILGKITRRSDLQGVDIFGAGALNNASPLSGSAKARWKLSLQAKSSQGEDDVTDVELDLYLAIRG